MLPVLGCSSQMFCYPTRSHLSSLQCARFTSIEDVISPGNQTSTSKESSSESTKENGTSKCQGEDPSIVPGVRNYTLGSHAAPLVSKHPREFTPMRPRSRKGSSPAAPPASSTMCKLLCLRNGLNRSKCCWEVTYRSQVEEAMLPGHPFSFLQAGGHQDSPGIGVDVLAESLADQNGQGHCHRPPEKQQGQPPIHESQEGKPSWAAREALALPSKGSVGLRNHGSRLWATRQLHSTWRPKESMGLRLDLLPPPAPRC